MRNPWLLGLLCGIACMAGCGEPPREEPQPSTAEKPTGPVDYRVGMRVHVTGCENDALMVPVVNLWDSAQRSRVVANVSGDGREDQGLKCQGAVVIVRDVGFGGGRTMFQVETVVGDQIGWVSELFIGRLFDTANCDTFFADAPVPARKCSSS